MLTTLSCSLLCNSIKTPKSHHSRKAFFSVSSPPQLQLQHKQHLSSLSYSPLRVLRMSKKGRFGAVCSASVTPRNLQWISTVSTVVLMLAKGTAINKAFLVPLFVLQAPATIISWIKGEYGIWLAFLALLVRLFYYIPVELELPFITFLLVIVSPYQITRLRGKQEGIILSLIMAIYLAFQHFVKVGSLGKAFDQGSILATIATICIVAVPCLLFI